MSPSMSKDEEEALLNPGEVDIYGEAPWMEYLFKHRRDEDTPRFMEEFTTLYIKARDASLRKAREEAWEEGAKTASLDYHGPRPTNPYTRPKR